MSRQYMVLITAALNRQQMSLFLHNSVNTCLKAVNYYSDGYFPFLFRVAIPKRLRLHHHLGFNSL